MANRQIIFYKNYFNEFYAELGADIRTKLNDVMKLVKQQKGYLLNSFGISIR